MKAFKILITCILALLIAAVCLGWIVLGDPIGQRKWDAVKVGMTKKAVINLLGEPTSLDGNQLQYSRPLNPGWVEFAFDTNEVLIWKNDESALVSLSRKFPYGRSDERVP